MYADAFLLQLPKHCVRCHFVKEMFAKPYVRLCFGAYCVCYNFKNIVCVVISPNHICKNIEKSCDKPGSHAIAPLTVHRCIYAYITVYYVRTCPLPTNTHTNKQTDRPTDRQKEADKQANKKAQERQEPQQQTIVYIIKIK